MMHFLFTTTKLVLLIIIAASAYSTAAKYHRNYDDYGKLSPTRWKQLKCRFIHIAEEYKLSFVGSQLTTYVLFLLYLLTFHLIIWPSVLIPFCAFLTLN